MEPSTEQMRLRRDTGGEWTLIGGAARRVAELDWVPAPVVPARLPIAAGRKIAELKRTPVLLIERDGRLAGLVDQQRLDDGPADARLEDAMHPLDLCLTPATSLARARELFARTALAVLPVAAGAFVLGAVTRDAVETALPALERDAGIARRRPRAGDDIRRRHAA
jgi:hypothetical protein